jgi:hypothetical protein
VREADAAPRELFLAVFEGIGRSDDEVVVRVVVGERQRRVPRWSRGDLWRSRSGSECAGAEHHRAGSHGESSSVRARIARSTDEDAEGFEGRREIGNF